MDVTTFLLLLPQPGKGGTSGWPEPGMWLRNGGQALGWSEVQSKAGERLAQLWAFCPPRALVRSLSHASATTGACQPPGAFGFY